MITVHGSGRSHGRAAGGTGAVVAEGDEAGRPPDRSRRRLIDGIRLQVRTGVPRRDVPVEYGPWGRAHDLFRCAANTVMGVAVTAGSPSRESVLATLRAAVLREEPFGPQGGLRRRSVWTGALLSKTVAAAFGALVVEVENLAAYTPHLKSRVEGLNRPVESMFFASLPGHVRQPRPGRRRVGPAGTRSCSASRMCLELPTQVNRSGLVTFSPALADCDLSVS
ncbi:transposase [Streptomyces sp. NPDC060333]|uniref:transposase n=1 Tax=Streptomyces sp. NPDC060333 TaxID=3347098 RepID=UPI0036593334